MPPCSQIFRCDVDCATNPTSCINHILYQQQTDAIVKGGFLAAGYNQVSIDDCWERRGPGGPHGNETWRTDPDSGRVNGTLVPNSTRFPEGLKALGDYMHNQGVYFGIYSDAGTMTCGGYPGSQHHEKQDAATLASWGVDYLKLDACNIPNDTKPDRSSPLFPQDFAAMGKAIGECGRNMTYSCSWPAALGNNETAKPFAAMIADGCNLWRNWHDIGCGWSSVSSIIDHWGDYGPSLAKTGGLHGDPGAAGGKHHTARFLYPIFRHVCKHDAGLSDHAHPRV